MGQNSSDTGNSAVIDEREGVRLFERTYPGTCAQNVGATLELAAEADLDALEHAVSSELPRWIRADPGEVLSGADGATAGDTTAITVNRESITTREEAQARAQSLVNAPFDIDSDPLVRAHIVSEGRAYHLLVLVAHRLKIDLTGILRMVAAIEVRYTGEMQPGSTLRTRDPDSDPERDLAFWRERIADMVHGVQLPGTDRRPQQRTFAGGVVHAELPHCRMPEAEPATTQQTDGGRQDALFSLFAAVIERYTRQDQFILGLVDTGGLSRPLVTHAENWLPVPLTLDRSESFEVNHRRIEAAAAEARQHGSVSFPYLLHSLDIGRAAGRPPLIQVLFQYLAEPNHPTPGHARHSYIQPLLADATPVDLHLVVVEEDGLSRLRLAYSGDVMDASDAQDMLDNLVQLAASARAEPDKALGRLRLLAPEQWQRIVVDFNRTDVPYPSDRCLHELVSKSAQHYPDATAFVFNGHALTYSDVERYSNSIAQHLLDHGIHHGDFVPLFMDRSLELPISMLGVMKAGAAFVPLDIHWPRERVEQIVLDATEKRVVLTGPGAPKDTATLPDGVSLISVHLAELEPIDTAPDIAVDSDLPIYMIYTSGSTGKPKGAINRHRGIVNRLTYMTQRYGCGEQDVILQTSAHIFDASVWQYFWPLINGRPAILPSPMIGFDYEQIIGLIERYRVTVTDFVPSVFNILVDFLDSEPSIRPKLETLRQLLIGGEALSPWPALRFLHYYPDASITNTYGPTETSIGVIFHEVSEEAEDPMPIGRPINNVKAFILDETQQPTPIGVQGRLHIGGECVGLGYHHDPDRTERVFPPSPFPDVSPGRIYDTGDLARYRRDGTIEFLGREDHQIKIRGIRVELGEIESILNRHPDINSSVVLVQETQSTRKLAAYFVPAEGCTPSIAELRLFLRARLPEYIIPNSFTQLAEFPLMRSGKVDRGRLPEPSDEEPIRDQRGPAPRTSLEETIAAAWRAELETDYVSLHDNFFDLGGDSLGVVKVALELQQRAGLQLDAEQMMIQTLGQIAASIEDVPDQEIGDGEPVGAPGPQITPLYFEAAGFHLYGCLHTPCEWGDEGVVICPPLGQEYVFTHRALKQLAQTLADQGIPVLRFDYPGTGDSSGEATDITLDACTTGILAASEVLTARTGCSRIHLVGLRFGAPLAAIAARKLERVDAVVFWDPVTDGSAYLHELTQRHSSSFRDPAPRFRSMEAGIQVADLLGFPFTQALLEQIRGIDLSLFSSLRDQPILWIDSTGEGISARPAERIANEVAQLEYRRIEYPEIWNQDPYKVRLPHGILRTISSWLPEQAT